MRNSFLISLISILGLVGVIAFLKSTDSELPPLATELVESQLTEEEKHELKHAWINSMHKAAPNVNWKIKDEKTRQKLAVKSKWQNRAAALDTFANGKLLGNWEERGSNNQSGRILMNEYDAQNEIIYSLSQGGNLWKGFNNGQNWQVINDAQNFASTNYIKLLQKGGNQRVFVSTSQTNNYYSDDDGQTWKGAKGFENIEKWGGIRKSVSLEDADQTIFTLALEWDYQDWTSIMSIYTSNDLGENFQKVQSIKRSVGGSNSNQYDIWASDDELYYLQKDSVFKFNNFGNKQFLSTIPTTNTGRMLITGSDFYTSDIIYVFADQDIFKSRDGGLTWTQKGNVSSNPFRNTSFFVRQQDTNTVYLGGVNCFVSTNSGQTWNIINEWWEYYGDPENKLHADIPSIDEFEDKNGNRFVLIATDGGLYKTTSPMIVDNLSLTGHNVSQYYSVYTNKNDYNYVYAGSQDQGFQRTQADNGGVLDFDQVISGDYGYIVSSDGGNSFWTVYPGFAHFYPDGKNGTGEARWNFDSLRNEYWIPPLEEHPINPEKVYLAGGYLKANNPGSFIIELTRFGNNITANQLPYNFNQVNNEKISAFEISDLDPNYWYVLTNEGYFYTSTDGGQTFSKSIIIDGPGAHYFYGASIHCSDVDKEKVFIGGSGYSNPSVFMTADAGNTFFELSDSLPNTLVFDIVASPDDSLVFAATEVGPFVLNITTKIWEPMFGQNGPLQRYWAVEFLAANNTIRFATHGRGIWDFVPYSPSVAGLTDAKQAMELSVYPNPTTATLFVKGLTRNATVTCVSLNGKQILLHRTQNQMDVSQLPKGTYLLTVKQNGKQEVLRFVKN